MSLRLLRAAAALFTVASLIAPAGAFAASSVSTVAKGAGKSFLAEGFRAHPGSLRGQELDLGPIDPLEVATAKAANRIAWEKRLQIGIGRPLRDVVAGAPPWERVQGGFAAHWQIRSPGARALRVELALVRMAHGAEIRFSGAGDSNTVYGPFTVAEVATGEPGYWSPVLTGESAWVEIFVPDGLSPSDAALVPVQVSHLFVHPADARAEDEAKDGSDPCERDLICESATNPALARVGKSVARMTFTSGGSTYLCTGTLLNPTDGSQTPYFYTAHHCIGSQAVASTLTTHWFYERTACGSGSTSSSYRQIAGGATRLYSSSASDAAFLRLNAAPPAGAVFAAWDSGTVSSGLAITAIHHPAGDWKKVSLGSTGGFLQPIPAGPTGSFIIVNWIPIVNWGIAVTEGGSSGSGIFTAVGSPASEYRFRGGLYGGPSTCAPESIKADWYSRFDQAYASIRQYLDPVVIQHALTVTRSGGGAGTVASSPSGVSCPGSCTASFPAGTVVALSATPGAGSEFSGWSGACSGAAQCTVTMNGTRTVTATFAVVPPPVLAVSASSVDFGNQLLGATSAARAIMLTNTGGGSLTFPSIQAAAGFGATHDCIDVRATASCAVQVTFTPAALGAQSGALTIVSSAGTRSVVLGGFGQESLVAHYYQSILGRNGETGGVAFWNGEAVRLNGLGANVNETWFAMAMSFYFSPEYMAFNRTDSGFLTDLYNTFYKRAPDPSGLAFWSSQIAAGMPREVVLLSFMFSPEFGAFTQGLYGNTTARAEVDTVMDLYRGLFARLPDTGGLNFYVDQFRVAQCLGWPGAVYSVIESMTTTMLHGAEYAGRGRTDAQFVADAYNAFLRRGGDLGGVLYWIQELQSGARTREDVRRAFIASPEFTSRVNAILAQGCVP